MRVASACGRCGKGSLACKCLEQVRDYRLTSQSLLRSQFTMSDNLSWCVAMMFENEMISESRAAELLGIGAAAFRDTSEEWTKVGWLKRVWENRSEEMSKDLRRHKP